MILIADSGATKTEWKPYCLVALSLVLVSCQEPPGCGVNMVFFPQTCESIAVKEVLADNFSFCIMVKGNEAEHDFLIESLASEWHHKVHPGFKSTPGGSALEALRYTTTPFTGFKISCQGSDVSDSFLIRSPGGSMCWFNQDKQIISIPESGISIAGFLKLSPLTPVSITLFAKDLSKEEMAGRTFTIELETDNAKTMTAEWVYEP